MRSSTRWLTCVRLFDGEQGKKAGKPKAAKKAQNQAKKAKKEVKKLKKQIKKTKTAANKKVLEPRPRRVRTPA